MTRYAYAGDHPVPDGKGGVVRPGEIREQGGLPGFGPWDVLPDEALAALQAPAEAPPVPPPPPVPPAPARASTPPPAAEKE